MTRRFRFIFVGAVIAALLTAGAIYAQGPGPFGPGGRGGRGPGGAGMGLPLQALELTDAQREQVRQMVEQHRQQTQGLMTRLRAAEDGPRQAMDATPVDEARIRASIQELAGVQAELAVARARLQSDVFALLTPEQQQEAQKLRAEREARLKERQERMQQRLQQRGQRPQA